MAQIHGKAVVVTINASDLSAYSNNVEFKQEADNHDTTTFGAVAKKYVSGLRDATATIEGIYESGAAGPGSILRPKIGGIAYELIYKPEGAGTGKPLATGDVLVKSYVETAPVADMITWSAEVQFVEDVTWTTA